MIRLQPMLVFALFISLLGMRCDSNEKEKKLEDNNTQTSTVTNNSKNNSNTSTKTDDGNTNISTGSTFDCSNADPQFIYQIGKGGGNATFFFDNNTIEIKIAADTFSDTAKICVREAVNPSNLPDGYSVYYKFIEIGSDHPFMLPSEVVLYGIDNTLSVDILDGLVFLFDALDGKGFAAQSGTLDKIGLLYNGTIPRAGVFVLAAPSDVTPKELLINVTDNGGAFVKPEYCSPLKLAALPAGGFALMCIKDQKIVVYQSNAEKPLLFSTDNIITTKGAEGPDGSIDFVVSSDGTIIIFKLDMPYKEGTLSVNAHIFEKGSITQTATVTVYPSTAWTQNAGRPTMYATVNTTGMAAVGYIAGDSYGYVSYSSDNGKTWNKTTTFGTPLEDTQGQIHIAIDDSGVIYAVGNDNLLTSGIMIFGRWDATANTWKDNQRVLTTGDTVPMIAVSPSGKNVFISMKSGAGTYSTDNGAVHNLFSGPWGAVLNRSTWIDDNGNMLVVGSRITNTIGHFYANASIADTAFTETSGIPGKDYAPGGAGLNAVRAKDGSIWLLTPTGIAKVK